MTLERQNHKTVNFSCRLDKNTYDQLVEDAAKQGISINSLVNSITKHHVTWERYADEIGFVPITKRMLGKMFKQLDQETIQQLAKELGGTVTKELLFLTYDKMSFENLTQMLEINALRFGVVHHTEEDGVHTLNIRHGIGENFSYFLACTHSFLAGELSVKLDITNLDQNMICMEIANPK